jgi:NAD(P)H-dependent FMN reductase
MLAEEVISGLEERGVECETLRLADLNILPGVSSDEGEGEAWPAVREKILASEIVILGTPTWLGQMSSVAKRALERMDAMLSEQDEAGQMIAFNRVAGSVVLEHGASPRPRLRGHRPRQGMVAHDGALLRPQPLPRGPGPARAPHTPRGVGGDDAW